MRGTLWKEAYLAFESQAERDVLVPSGLSWLSFGRGGGRERKACASQSGSFFPGPLEAFQRLTLP